MQINDISFVFFVMLRSIVDFRHFMVRLFHVSSIIATFLESLRQSARELLEVVTKKKVNADR